MAAGWRMPAKSSGTVTRVPARDVTDETSRLVHELSERLTAIAMYAGAAQRLARRNASDDGHLEAILGKTCLQAGLAADILRRLRDLADPVRNDVASLQFWQEPWTRDKKP